MIARIVGLRRCGKSTLFNLLSGREETGGRFGEKRLTVCRIADKRVSQLAEVYSSQKTTFPEIKIEEIPELSSRMLPDIKDADALIVPVRLFDDPVTREKPSPKKDIKEIDSELILNDVKAIETRLGTIERYIKKGASTQEREELERERALLTRLEGSLESGIPVRQIPLDKKEVEKTRNYSFASGIPILYLLNHNDDYKETAEALADRLSSLAGTDTLPMNVKLELELASLPDDERRELIDEFELEPVGADFLIKKVYNLLGLISFLTANEHEARAWTVKAGTDALHAAGTVHKDIQKGFIRAEVISFNELASVNFDTNLAKKKGLLRLEGKDYIVKDGDVILFRFNV
ncbi:DUF933 domain-containing protein [bacterium]|nr:DUF933 domain-containing protein [bacterium]